MNKTIQKKILGHSNGGEWEIVVKISSESFCWVKIWHMNRSSQHSVILDTKLSGTEFSGTSKKIWLCWFCPVFQKFCSQSENVVPFSTKTFQRTQTWIFNIMETTLRSSKGTYQNLGKWAHIISEIVLAFWLVLTYDLLEDRFIDDIMNILFCFFIIYTKQLV